MDDLPQQILIWGLGKETSAFFRYLSRVDWQGECLVFDDSAAPSSSELKTSYPALHFQILDKEALGLALEKVTLVVRSPGVSIYRPELAQYLKREGCTTTTSTSIALGLLDRDKCIGVTGTKGKSSTSTMLYEVLKNSGYEVVLAGNIGRPLIDYLPQEHAGTFYIVELSSYQISDMHHFPKTAIMLNLYEDHLDWHLGVENYHRDKLRLVNNADVEWCAVNGALADGNYIKTSAETVWFNAPDGVYFTANTFCQGDVSLDGSALLERLGAHMMENACAVLTVAQHLGIDSETALKGLENFEPLMHRQQVLKLDSPVKFVNDSISTTPQSTIAALDRFSLGRLHVIIGGADRGVDYADLTQRLMQPNIIAIQLIGEVGARLAPILSALAQGETPKITRSPTLDHAMQNLTLVAGDTVLLSPAASSYDQFSNFEARGRHFASLAEKIRL